MSNLLNEIKFIEYKNSSSIQMKQGDLTPIFIELIGAKKTFNNPTPEKATLFLIDISGKTKFKKEFDVNYGQIKLIIDEILPVGRYYIEINHGGRIYPSLNSHSIQINATADLT